MNQLVRIRPEIGRGLQLQRRYREGATLADIVADSAELLPPEFWKHGVAIIGGDKAHPYPPEVWSKVRPKKGFSVDFGIAPGDDEGFSSILQVAIIGAQLFASTIPGIGPLVSAAIGIGGQMLLSLLAPKPEKTKKEGSPKQLGTGGFSSNVLSPYEQLSCVKGRKRVAAPHLGPPFMEVVGEDALGTLCIGLAGRHEVSEILVNGSNPASGLVDGGPYIRTGLPSDGPLQLYTKVVWQEPGQRMSEWNLLQDPNNNFRYFTTHQASVADALQDAPVWSKFRLGKIRPDRIVVDILWDSGMAQSQNTPGAGCAFDLMFVRRGALPAPDAYSLSMVTPRTFLPQLHWATAFKAPIRGKIIIEFAPDPGGLSPPSGASPWVQAFSNSSAQSTSGTSAHAYYGASAVADHVGVSSPNIVTIYVDPNEIDIEATDELWIRKGPGYLTEEMVYSTNQYNFASFAPVPGLWWTPILWIDGAIYCMEDQAKVYATCVIEYCTRIWDTEPFDPDGLTTIEMRLRNTQVDSISFVADGYVKWKWDNSILTWTNEPHVSENPAEIAYDIKKNPDPVMNSRPLAAALVDDLAMGEWAEWARLNGKRCNAIIEGGSVEDALALCYQAGHAKLVRSRKWAPWIEKDRSGEAPIKIYGPRDFWNWTIEKSFDRKPHALRTTFDDQDDDWITTPERLVYAPNRDETNSTLFEAVHYPSIDTDYNVDARAKLDLAIMRKRSGSYSFETRHRWLATPRGSLIGVSHPMLHANHVTAGIRKVIYNGDGDIVGVILDGEIELLAGTTGVSISGLNAEVFAAETLQPGPAREIMFSTPIANDAGIDEGALFAAGPTTYVYGRFYVDDIKPGPRFGAKLILVDEAPRIHVAGNNDLYASPDLYAEPDLYNLNN